MKHDTQLPKIAKFEKVSYAQFAKDWAETFANAEDTERIYESIRLPRRATVGSAGYDICTPIDFTLAPQQSVKIPTGLRVKMAPGWVLCNFPRSGLGFKYRLQLNNTVGIIDSDYYDSSNEGHLFTKITNDTKEDKVLSLRAGDAFCQGIFLPYGITVDDDADGVRDGGFGSTGK